MGIGERLAGMDGRVSTNMVIGYRWDITVECSLGFILELVKHYVLAYL